MSFPMKPVALAILLALLQLPGRAAQAQTAPEPAIASAPAPTAPPHLILVTINWWESRFGSTLFLTALFDTNGQGLAGLSEAELNKKYAKVPRPASPVSIINFVVQSGYRVVSFTTTQGGAGADASRYSVTNGYVFLCEQVR
ncbi:MAG: hypothetical protein M3Y12_15355 [Bacteroidota bacterium]|nr:hypothetical protein [Bacteroidota bacterium]